MSYFGIDLGTSNSLIGNAATGYLSDLVPSIVNLKTKTVGYPAYNDFEAERVFKLSMSMDMGGAVPRLASAEVLKKLRSLTGNAATDVIISVPAFFNTNQRSATIEAASMAGLNVIGLINEPTAAAAYIARGKKSLFVVMDLGGGTFDVSIVDSRFGPYIVQASDGIVPCGGSNLDYEVMRYLSKQAKVPIFMMSKEAKSNFQIKCQEFKIEMSKNYPNDVSFDLSEFQGPKSFKFKAKDYRALVEMVFKRTVEKTKHLIENNIPGETFEILLVGGSTKDPYYRDLVVDMLKHEVAPLTYDPDRVVAQGAAYCAMLKERGEFDITVHDVTKALSVGLANGLCRNLISPNSSIPCEVSEMFTNDEACEVLHLELYQGSSQLSKENEYIGELNYPYGREVAEHEGIVYVTISVDDKGVITFKCNESLQDPVVVKLNIK